MSPDRPLIHENQPLVTGGTPLEEASAAMIMIHGRGATAPDILTLSKEFDAPGMAFLAPQAAQNTWYPYSFLAPLAQNEPYLGSALAKLDALLSRLGDSGIRPERTVLLGFSQGACLATEYAARNPRPYGALVALSGGLIGPPGTPRAYQGSLQDVAVFLGCSDVDPHIPVERVHETEKTLADMGANVTKRLYQGMGHTVNQDEIDLVQSLLEEILV
jgi:predicted esterase